MATATSRNLNADVRYFNGNAPPEMFDNGVLTLGETPGISKEEFKRRRQLTTETKQVTMLDARTALPNGLQAWNLDIHGFCCVPAPFPVVDFSDRERVKKEHYPKLIEIVKKLTGAKEAFFMQNFQTRTENPLNLSIAYARFGHCDGGPEFIANLRKELVKKHKVPEAEAQSCDIVMAGLWHPWDRPAYKDPLCLLDFTSVNWKEEVIRYRYIVSAANSVKDTRSAEQIAADAKDRFKASEAVRQQTTSVLGQKVERQPKPFKSPAGIGPIFAPTHRWVYCPDMPTEQMWVWKNWDTREGVAKCCFHNSFHDPFHDEDDSPGRRNVEHRMVLIFPKKDGSGNTDPDWVPVAKL